MIHYPMTPARLMSIEEGLKIPEDKVYCIYCSEHDHKLTGKAASIHEMGLANKPHRWPEMRTHVKSSFREYMELVTKYEIIFLKILGLPDINTVRLAAKKQVEPFVLTAQMEAELYEATAAWLNELVGEAIDDASVYNVNQLHSFNIGTNRTYDTALQSATAIERDQIIAAFISPERDNPYLRGVLEQGGKRIRTQLAIDNMETLIARLEDASMRGINPVETARILHRTVGEGDAWYWLRLARSEGVLALNAAYDATIAAMGVNYEEWSTGPNPCFICSGLNGEVWLAGQGPEPVSDTHPSCVCIRVPLYRVDKTIINSSWDRPSPYDIPITPEEVVSWRGDLLVTT